jgi:hypothetical protein
MPAGILSIGSSRLRKNSFQTCLVTRAWLQEPALSQSKGANKANRMSRPSAPAKARSPNLIQGMEFFRSPPGNLPLFAENYVLAAHNQ